MATKDAPDGGCSDTNTKLAQFALDADTAPAAVLASEAKDELDQLGTDRRPTATALSPPRPPLPPSSFSVPSEQCPGRDEEGLPPSPGKEPAESDEQRTVSWAVLDAAMKLALKDTHLVTEDDQFEILVCAAAVARRDESQEPAKREVDEGEGHVR
ncbi:MAG: hypothetical protein ABSE77_10540 [Acidimicrobiales bacterium]|jgi:hypothetical protein